MSALTSTLDATATEVSSRERARRFMQDHPVAILSVVLAVLYIVTGINDPAMFTMPGVRSVLLLAAPLGFFAAAQTLVVLTGGFDLSIAMVANFAAYATANYAGLGTVPAIGLGLLAGVACGLLNGVGVGIFRVNALIMTIGVSAVVLGVVTVGMTSGGFLAGSKTILPIVAFLGGGSLFGPIPASMLVWLPLSVFFIWGMRSTGFGRMVYAVGDNQEACTLGGVRVWAVLLGVYVTAGLLSAMGGLLFSGISSSVGPDLTNNYLMPAIAATVIGGTSTMGGIGGYSGTIMGALILTVLNRLLLTLDTGEGVRQVVYGLIVLLLSWFFVKLSGQRAD